MRHRRSRHKGGVDGPRTQKTEEMFADSYSGPGELGDSDTGTYLGTDDALAIPGMKKDLTDGEMDKVIGQGDGGSQTLVNYLVKYLYG